MCIRDRIMLAQHLARSRARDVHGDVAAADDDDSLPDGELVAEIDVEQELDAAMHAIEINSRDREVAAAMCANCDQDGIEALASQFADREVASRGDVQAKRNVAVSRISRTCASTTLRGRRYSGMPR